MYTARECTFLPADTNSWTFGWRIPPEHKVSAVLAQWCGIAFSTTDSLLSRSEQKANHCPGWDSQQQPEHPVMRNWLTKPFFHLLGSDLPLISACRILQRFICHPAKVDQPSWNWKWSAQAATTCDCALQWDRGVNYRFWCLMSCTRAKSMVRETRWVEVSWAHIVMLRKEWAKLTLNISSWCSQCSHRFIEVDTRRVVC